VVTAHPDEDVRAFGETVSAALQSTLGHQLIGCYFLGSIAVGGYVPGESDVDIAAVCNRRLDASERLTVAEAVERTVSECPARGLEFTLYRAEVVSRPPADDGPDFEVNVNGGRRMDRVVRVDSAGQDAFWWTLDRAIAARAGVVITGPEPRDVFADVGREALLSAMVESMRWHRQHERATLYSVLNAARAWRYAETGELGSKLDGAAWAMLHWANPSVIDAAVDLRHGRPADLTVSHVEELLDHVLAVLENTRTRP
jgi:hypothetical protein